MAGNIGCFSADCNNPVIGQCSGYKGNCGQFYCHPHSRGKLCGECGGRKAHEEAMERTRQDYLETAKKMQTMEFQHSVIPGSFLLIVLSVFIGFICFASFQKLELFLRIVWGATPVVIAILLLIPII
jgi:hypothetical protein